jgi:hypothetical protein
MNRILIIIKKIRRIFHFIKLKASNPFMFQLLRKNKEFKNKHFGKRCFILGNGPSLNKVDLNKIKDDLIFTVNQFPRHDSFGNIIPNYHFWADPYFFSEEEKLNSLVIRKMMEKLHHNSKTTIFYESVGIDFLKTFTTDESLTIQTLPAFLHYSDFISKATIIPGEYDISKWVRPVEIVFETKNKQERIEIKKGDALCYYKFLTSDIVKLTQDETPWEEIIVCNNIRKNDLFRPLKERYDSFKKWREDNQKD